jgi:hypothetical protein
MVSKLGGLDLTIPQGGSPALTANLDKSDPLCKISKRQSDVYNKRVETWKESVNAFLLKRLGQKAMDDFRTVTFEYDHRECGRIEWIKKWLIELSDRLRRVDAQLDSYPRPS